jgi:glycosyltransferase involved in cell wall biosynthesis
MSIYYLAAKKAGVSRIIVHSHSSGINGHFRIVNYLMHIMARPIIKHAKYRCACSDIAAVWMFGTTTNVNIIQNGVDIERYKFNEHARNNIRNELMLDGKIVIGSVSDFSYPKNPEFLYKLVKEFEDDDRYVFLFVGNRDTCKLKNLTDANDAVKNVIFAGTVTNTEDFLSAMDVFVLPSRFEGLPMCAIEAQVSGVHTIISDKVTADTQCSSHFDRLKLNLFEWKKTIGSINLNFDRAKITEYLDEEKASASNTATQFKHIYSDEV